VDEAILVPAGTIHAIGAGLVIAEVQQRSDATFRLFDYGRQRELHIDGAVGAALAGPALPQAEPERLSEARLVVAQSPFFVLERIDLAPNSYWEVDADRETWLLLLDGDAKFDLLPVTSGEAVFIDDQRVRIRVGSRAVTGLLAYVGNEPLATMLQSRNGEAHESMVERFPELGDFRTLIKSAPTRGRGVRS
jgi:mannose-6-phosphate isomerase